MSRAATAVAAVGASAVAAVLVLRRRFGAVVVVGGSMEPTLHAGDRLVYRRRVRGIAVGTIVVLDTTALRGWTPAPGDPTRMVKRIVALSGHPRPDDVPGDDSLVPIGHVVVRGDNVRSLDSRTWGPVPEAALVGVVPDRAGRSGRRVGGGAPARS